MPVVETFFGYVETTKDSLLLLEACRQGILPRVGRRLQEQERHLVKSGAVFCFDQNESGIKRWTDGLIWSPSRILGNFLIYRELGNRRNSSDEDDDDQQRSLDDNTQQITSGLTLLSKRQREKSLVGSLRNSYQFKDNGLIKKSMSVVVNGVHQHLISYYNKDDVLTNKFQTPSNIPELAALTISAELLCDQHFRIPFFLQDESNGTTNQYPGAERPTKQKRRSASHGQPTNSRRHCRISSRSSVSSAISNNSGISTPLIDQSTPSDLAQEDTQQTYIPPTKPELMIMNQRHLSDSAIYSQSYHTPRSLAYQPQEGSQDSNLFIASLLTSPRTQQPSIKYSPFGYQESQNKLIMTPVSHQYHRDLQQQQQRQHLDTLPDRISFGVGSDYQPWVPHSFSTGYSAERSDQNPHQHLFSSSSFHAINHASLHAGRELVSNAFMLDTSSLLGSGWNDFELQM